MKPPCEKCPANLTVAQRGGQEVAAIQIIDRLVAVEINEFPPNCLLLVKNRTCKAADKLEEAISD